MGLNRPPPVELPVVLAPLLSPAAGEAGCADGADGRTGSCGCRRGCSGGNASKAPGPAEPPEVPAPRGCGITGAADDGGKGCTPVEPDAPVEPVTPAPAGRALDEAPAVVPEAVVLPVLVVLDTDVEGAAGLLALPVPKIPPPLAVPEPVVGAGTVPVTLPPLAAVDTPDCGSELGAKTSVRACGVGLTGNSSKYLDCETPCAHPIKSKPNVVAATMGAPLK